MGEMEGKMGGKGGKKGGKRGGNNEKSMKEKGIKGKKGK